MIDPFQTLEPLGRFEDIVIVDLGTNAEGRAPLDAYAAGHIPGAVFVDLDRWLSAPPSPQQGRHPLPAPEVFIEGMRRAGIGESDTVIAYDRVGGVFAARLVWMLRAVAVNAALLDGGLTAISGDLEQGVNTRARSDFSRGEIPKNLLASLDEVRQVGVDCAENRQGIPVLLDAREAHRYRGDPHPLDDVSGHIPGARSLPCREHVDEQGKILPREQLRARLSAAGVARDTQVISACGSGVTACHNLLILEHLGFGAGRLYPGSWSQWSSSETTVAVGEDPCATLVTVP